MKTDSKQSTSTQANKMNEENGVDKRNLLTRKGKLEKNNGCTDTNEEVIIKIKLKRLS